MSVSFLPHPIKVLVDGIEEPTSAVLVGLDTGGPASDYAVVIWPDGRILWIEAALIRVVEPGLQLL